MRVALASYRSKPHSGGQGVYVRNLSRELVGLGHQVTVFSGPPYPELDPGVRLERLPSLDLYRDDDPFRRPARHEFRSAVDVLEYAIMCSSGFPEPRTFAIRLSRQLRDRVEEFDVLHDNQTLAPGILDVQRRGLPLVTTIHHPISRDRRLELAAARGIGRLTKRRWYGFVAMQRRVARRLDRIITVSRTSATDIAADFGVHPSRMTIVPVGVDVDAFVPRRDSLVPGRLVAIASADVPLKGVGVLVAALAQLPEQAWSELIVVGQPSDRTNKQLADAGLLHKVRFESGLTDAALAALIASAEVQVVPSLYEGFSLPAVEAMACGTPVVASAVGALPALLGDGVGVLVEPGDAGALADALSRTLADAGAREAYAARGRERAVGTYSWRAVAQATADVYESAVTAHQAGRPRANGLTRC